VPGFLFSGLKVEQFLHYNGGKAMDDRELGIMAAIILGGIVGGERSSADEKTIKRSIDIAVRLKVLLQERIQAHAAGTAPPPVKPAG
jgi:hypothetical protein